MGRFGKISAAVVIAAAMSGAGTVSPAGAAGKCRRVPVATQAMLEGRLTGDQVTLGKTRAVRSDDFERVYFVASELEGPSLEDDGEVAVWAMNRLRNPNFVFSVGGFAHEFSDWTHGEDSSVEMSISDDGYEAAQDCL